MSTEFKIEEIKSGNLVMLRCRDEVEWAAACNFRQKYFFDKVPILDPYTWTFNHLQHEHLVLYFGTEIIGYMHIQFWPDARAAMWIIVIDKNMRNNNFGSSFLGLCEKWLKNIGYKSIHMQSSPAAVAFYKKHGYIEMPFNDPENQPIDPSDVPLGKVL